MKKLVIKSKSSRNRVANLIAKKIRSAVSIYSNAPVVEVEEQGISYTIISVKANENTSFRMLTFAEIDTVREVVDIYKEKYEYGRISYSMQGGQYLAQDGETWLSMPVMEISISQSWK